MNQLHIKEQPNMKYIGDFLEIANMIPNVKGYHVSQQKAFMIEAILSKLVLGEMKPEMIEPSNKVLKEINYELVIAT